MKPFKIVFYYENSFSIRKDIILADSIEEAIEDFKQQQLKKGRKINVQWAVSC
jgi:hypothetical protein